MLLDLQVADDFALRTERIRGSLPRASAMCRFAVPALLRTRWWPMISFVVFKAPHEGRTDVFRRGDPFMQMIFVLVEPEFELVALTEAEAAERKLLDCRIYDSRETLVKDSTGSSLIQKS